MCVTSDNRRENGQIWSIQYLRAGAAISVLVFHQLGYRAPIFLLGQHGVDIFFVISGFIMVTMTDGRPISPGRFVLDRLTRIVPLYWLATLLVVLAVAVQVPVYGGSSRIDLLAGSLLFIPSLNSDGQTWPTLYVGWTLNLEMLFYAIFAAGLFLPARYRLVSLAVTLTILVFSALLVRWSTTALAFYTNPIVLEFLAGAVLGRLFGIDLHRRSHMRVIALPILVIVAMGGLLYLFPQLIAGWAAVAIVTGGLWLERAGMMPSIDWLKMLGDASFAIYLFQPFAFVAVLGIMDWAMFVFGMPRIPGLIPGLSVVTAIVLGVVVHRRIERPITRAVREQATLMFAVSPGIARGNA